MVTNSFSLAVDKARLKTLSAWLMKHMLVEPAHHVTKIITWKRSTSSSRNELATKDYEDDNGSDFIEEFGSHSSTLDRVHSWERKLYDEVKAFKSTCKEYEQKCDQLKQQFAKDHAAPMIDKIRAVVKDLHPIGSI